MMYAIIAGLLIVELVTLVLFWRMLKTQMAQQEVLDCLGDDVGEQAECLAFILGKLKNICSPVEATKKKPRPAAKKKKGEAQ